MLHQFVSHHAEFSLKSPRVVTKLSDFFPDISDILQKNSEIIWEKSKIFLRALSYPPISLPINMKKVLFTLLFLLASIATFAQQSPAKS